jgi:hypothetical protein
MKVYAVSRPQFERSTEPTPCQWCGRVAHVDALVDTPERRFCRQRYELGDGEALVLSVCRNCLARASGLLARKASR